MEVLYHLGKSSSFFNRQNYFRVNLHLTTVILHYLFSPIPSEIEGRMESLKVAKFRGRLYFTLKSVRNSTEILKLKQDDFSPIPSYLSYKYTIIPETQYMKGQYCKTGKNIAMKRRNH